MNTKSNNSDLNSMSDRAIVNDICSSLKQIRLNKNISQSTLALNIGVSRPTISRMESGVTAITLTTFVQILRGLGELDRLKAFKETIEISPLNMLNFMGKTRRYASHQRISNTHKQKSE